MKTDHPLRGNDYLQFSRKLRQIGLDNGIVCNQSHAPFPTDIPEIRDYLKRAIECTAEAGGEICIIHPSNNYTAQENAEFYFTLLPFAKQHGVKIATENMFNWIREEDTCTFAACATPQSFMEHFDAVNNDEYLVACLDIGHSEMCGVHTSAVDMILTLKDKLQALHIHDNDQRHDSHQIPFSMKIDFAPIVKALKQIGYKGYFTLEASNYLKNWDSSRIFEGVCDLAQSAKKLAKMFEEC
jgi:sugar phosphate isomerase/epimerase